MKEKQPNRFTTKVVKDVKVRKTKEKRSCENHVTIIGTNNRRFIHPETKRERKREDVDFSFFVVNKTCGLQGVDS